MAYVNTYLDDIDKGSKMRIKSCWLLALAMFAAAALTGCATLGGGAGNVGKAVSLINQSDAELLTQNSAVPFIFEGEVLLRRSDVAAVWRNLSINGFRLSEEDVFDAGNIDDTTFRIFSDAEEMRVFFSKYVPFGSTLGRIKSGGKEYHVILGNVSGGYPQILGITGF
jgi:hypothetical protein